MKKLFALLLATVMVISTLTACGSQNTGSSAAPSPSQTGSAPATTKEPVTDPVPATADEKGRTYEGVHKIANGDLTLDILVQVQNSDYADPQTMEDVKKFQELTGVNLNIELVMYQDWETKFNLVLASEELPDIIIIKNNDIVNVEELGVVQNLLIPLDDYVNAELMPNYIERLQETIDAGQDPTTPLYASDGKMYSLGTLWSKGQTCYRHFFINQTWLKEVGKEVPKTIDELTDVLRAFKQKYPDYVPFEVGITAKKNGYKWDLLPLFGIPTDCDQLFYIDNDGKVQFPGNSEGFRECMEWLHTLYTEGLLDPEVLSQDDKTITTKFQEGNLGMFISNRLTGMGYEALEKDMVCMLPPSEKTLKGLLLDQCKSAAFITNQNEHVEESMRLLDSMIDTDMMFDFYYGDRWFYNADGMIEQSESNNGDVYTNLQGLWHFMPQTYLENRVVTSDSLIEQHDECQMYMDAGIVSKYSSVMLEYVPINSDMAADLALIETDALNAMNEAAADFVQNGVTDESWANYIAKFNSIGVPKYIEEYQRALDASGLLNK